MLRMAQIKYIKDLYENEEASLREICRITGHSFETVRKYAYQENWSEDNLPDIEPQSYPVLQDFIPIIDKWLEEDRKAPRKQRHTVMRIYHRLCDEHGFTGCYRPDPLKLSGAPLLNYNPNLSAYDGLMGGEAHG